MRKTLSVILLLFFICAVISAQTENKNSVETDSKTTNLSQQSAYSESSPYTPREFKAGQESELKKKKKSKKEVEKENQTASPTGAQETANENSVKLQGVTIKIPVSVFDSDGNLVQNLKKNDFKISVGGQEQEIADFGVDDSPLNIILVLDISPSTAYEIEEMQKYAASIVNQLRPQDKVMIVTFDEQTKVLAELTGDHQKAANAIKKAKFGDGTALYETVKYSLQKHISQINGRKFIVLMTDGVDTVSRKATYEDSLLAAETTDALFFPVYIDTSEFMNKAMADIKTMNKNTALFDPVLRQIISQQLANRRNMKSAEEEYELGRHYLTDLVQLSGGRAITIKNLQELNKTKFESVFEAFRNQYYVSVNYADGGKIIQRKQIKVRVNRPNLTVLARGSYILDEDNQRLTVNSK